VKKWPTTAGTTTTTMKNKKIKGKEDNQTRTLKDPQMARHREVLNFEETYSGLSDEDEDVFNDETFGTNVPLGKDFNFGGPGGSTSAPAVNYAEAARSVPQPSAFGDDALKPMESLWQQQQAPRSQQQEPISVDQIEARLSQGNPPQSQGQAQQQQQFPPQVPQQMFPQQGGYFYPPGFIPPMPQGYNIPPQFGVPPQQFQQFPPVDQLMIQQGQFPPQGQLPPQQGPPSQQQFQQPPQDQPEQIQQQQPQQQEQVAQMQEQPQRQLQDNRKPDLSDFPVLGSNDSRGSAPQSRDQQYAQHQQHHNPHQHQHQHQQQQRHRQHYHQHYDNFNELPEEEKQRIMKRQQKVQRIVQFCGVMTPRDKDFVSRIQLSQIVTDDPYIDDFYFQVHRLLKTGQAEVDNNNVAQSYLDLSGHRLGGRYQRADVALQRMQQQVQKAVTYAKGRSKTHPVAKGGALGKISVLGKTPRKQLEITYKPELPEVTKSGRKSILLQIENIYQKVLELESAQRENKEIDTSELWESLKLFEESDNMNFFIQILSYEKGLKIFPRVYHFLDRQQKLTIITLIFANLSLIKIITKSSFKNHENDEIPADVQKTIELFQHVVLKTIMVFLSYETVITEIIGLMTILIEHNNVAFLATSKLGTSLITILLSRAEIIKQEQNISSEDIQDWANAYDKLFSSLETKLSLLFPATKSNYDDSYIWQFFASLALSGKLNHQRIIVDEIRDEIFGSVTRAKESDDATKLKIISNLNLFLNVIGLNANGEEIVELK
jgi:DNA topoisomerase 2-associated protein PAT1